MKNSRKGKISLKPSSDEYTCLLIESFLSGNTKKSRLKLYKYLDKKIIEDSEQIRELENVIELCTQKLQPLKNELEELRIKSKENIERFISLEKELLNKL